MGVQKPSLAAPSELLVRQRGGEPERSCGGSAADGIFGSSRRLMGGCTRRRGAAQSQPQQQQQQQQQQQWPSSLETEAHPINRTITLQRARPERLPAFRPRRRDGMREQLRRVSWDAVRALILRHRKRATRPMASRLSARPSRATAVAVPLDPSGRRPKKNAYGDDVLSERTKSCAVGLVLKHARCRIRAGAAQTR